MRRGAGTDNGNASVLRTNAIGSKAAIDANASAAAHGQMQAVRNVAGTDGMWDRVTGSMEGVPS